LTSRRIALAASIIGSGIVFLDTTIVNVALPAIREGLHGGLAAQQWVVEAYLLTLSSLLLIGGSFGDLFGRRTVFRAGVIAFGACSVLCALAPSAGFLIAARALQGAAGALLVPSTLALIVDTFPEGQARAKAIGTWSAWSGIATVAGPLGGGALVQFASWRWIFAVNVIPVAIVATLLTKLETDRRRPAHVDIKGALLCAIGLGGPVFALIEQPTYGWRDPRVLAPLVIGITTLAAFVITERRSADPMLPLELFRRRNFAVGNVTTLAMWGALNVSTFLVVVFIQQVAGYSALEAGLAMLPITLLIFALSRRFGGLADRLGPRAFMGGGPIVAAAGLLLLTRLGAHSPYATTMLPGVLVFGLGMSATVAPLTATVLSSVPQGHSGVASGVNNAVARVAGLLAIAVVGAVVSASFAARLTHDASALPPAVRPALRHQRTKPFVTTTTHAEPGFHHALQDASVRALHAGLLVAAALAFLGGVVALAGIENPRPRTEPIRRRSGLRPRRDPAAGRHRRSARRME
jgi:EmrB/QacA subfamily drug resistance transporter